MPSFPQKRLLSLQYISNYIGKLSRCHEVSVHTVIFLKIVSQNAPDCISAHIHFKKFPGGGACPWIPLGRYRPLGTSPQNDKSQLEPYVHIKIITLCESRQQNYHLCKPSFLKNNKNVLIEPSDFTCDATIRV